MVCACCPIIALEGYRSWVSYQTQLTDSQSRLLKELQGQQNTVVAFFDAICRDIAFVAHMTEFHSLLIGIEDDDVDEIAYWTEALTTVLKAVAENRSVFTDSAQEQALGMNQITDAMESIRKARLQNVESSRQLDSASQNLQELGQVLQHMVTRYTY